jgi:MFS transporter, DHA2 family, multidrug resistance protein
MIKSDAKYETSIEIAVHRRKWIAVVALGLSLFLSALDATIVALALPPIAAHFQLSDAVTAEVTLAYAIPLTILILPASSIVNRFRSLPVFLISVLGFGAGSVICGLAPNFLTLLAGRVIQGSFAALIGTLGFALAASIVSPKERGKAMGIIGTVAPLGGVAGPGIGGLLLANFGWSSIFFVNLPVIIAASILGIYSLRGTSLHKAGNSVYGQMLGLLRNAQFLFPLLAFFFSVSTSVALYYLLPFDLDMLQHIGPAVSGGLLLCVPLGMMVMGMASGYLTDRYGPRPFILIGVTLLLTGILALSLVTGSRTSEPDIVWRLMLIGAGIGLFSSPTQTVIMSAGRRELMGAASALSNLSARLGTVFSPLVIGVIWSLVASFSAQMESGTFIVIGLAFVTFILAVLSALKVVQKHYAS